MKNRTFLLTCIAMLAPVIMAGAASAAEVRFHGSSTVTSRVMASGKEPAQAACGLTLVVVGNGTENGLDDLTKGRCDAAMASEPLPDAVANLKKANPDAQVPPDLQAHVITKDVIVVIAHPSNTVRSLTKEQVKGMMTGTIKSWKEVGGTNPQIAIVTSNPGSGTRKVFQKLAMDDEKYDKEAIEAPATDQEIKLVNEIPEAIGAVSAGIANEAAKAGKVKIIETPEFSRPLLFVTVGAPKPQVRKVIDFFQGDGQKYIK
jgi:phosphate transport system substrate-binding protein